jgi:hypothetical protein
MANEEELFEIELAGIERTLGRDLGDTAYDVEFDCTRGSAIVHITVTLDADTVTTTEIVPFAMSELNRAFAALSDQTKSWRIEPGGARPYVT